MLHHPSDVFVEKSRKLPCGEVTLLQPVRVVESPDQAMAADLHLMCLSEADQLVALAKVESSAIPAQHPPLHRIFRLHHAELARQRRGIVSLRKFRRANRGANEDAVA